MVIAIGSYFPSYMCPLCFYEKKKCPHPNRRPCRFEPAHSASRVSTSNQIILYKSKLWQRKQTSSNCWKRRPLPSCSSLPSFPLRFGIPELAGGESTAAEEGEHGGVFVGGAPADERGAAGVREGDAAPSPDGRLWAWSLQELPQLAGFAVSVLGAWSRSPPCCFLLIFSPIIVCSSFVFCVALVFVVVVVEVGVGILLLWMLTWSLKW